MHLPPHASPQHNIGGSWGVSVVSKSNRMQCTQLFIDLSYSGAAYTCTYHLTQVRIYTPFPVSFLDPPLVMSTHTVYITTSVCAVLISQCHNAPLSQCPTLTMPHSHNAPLSHMPHSHNALLSQCPTLTCPTLSQCPTLTMPHSHNAPLSQCPTLRVTMPHSHNALRGMYSSCMPPLHALLIYTGSEYHSKSMLRHCFVG